MVLSKSAATTLMPQMFLYTSTRMSTSYALRSTLCPAPTAWATSVMAASLVIAEWFLMFGRMANYCVLD